MRQTMVAGGYPFWASRRLAGAAALAAALASSPALAIPIGGVELPQGSDAGSVTGSTRGVDFEAFGFGGDNAFAYVRPNDGPTAGADIDAVGAISTRLATPILVAEPSTLALFAGALAFSLAARRLFGVPLRRSAR